MTLPGGYTEVEYIQSTGLQYIDTGFKRNGDTVSYTADFAPDEVYDVNWCVVVGNTSEADGGTGMGCWNGQYICLVPWMGSNEFGYPSAGSRVSLTLTFSESTIGVSGDETAWFTSEHLSPSAQWNSSTYAIGHPTEDSYCKYYRVKFYRGSTLERDFVPCIRDSDNEVGMYDTVTNTFYTNSGSGSYIAGPAAGGVTINVYNGSSWTDGTLYVWNGTAWVEADTVYVFNGTAWVEKSN